MKLQIVYQNAEPTDKNVVWIQNSNGVLIQKVFGNKGWQIIGSPATLVTENGQIIPEESIDKYIFKISSDSADLASNIDTAGDIGILKTVNVHLIGKLYGITYDTVGVYHNGEISAVQGDTHIVLDVNFSTGVITQKSYYNLEDFLGGVELAIGNSDEVKNRNLEILRRITVKTNVFHAHIDYGIGVGSWVDGKGGTAHIVTAQGNETYYDIGGDGTISVSANYTNPNYIYSKYKSAGGTRSENEFINELINLIE